MSEPEMKVRPKWEWGLSEEEFRDLSFRSITRVDHGWRFLSEDTSEHWIKIESGDSDKKRITTIKEHKMSAFFELFEFKPHHAALFRLTYRGEIARKRLQEIDAFEKSAHRERLEYERLKKKFGNTPAP